jgi:2-(1,2-epoxy-1,2-dihydrophenyl)acetyl-CoA isomerase
MNYQTIQYAVAGGIARLVLNRPERLNSFNQQMHAEVRAVLDRVAGDGARVLVLTGAGRAFCAGQDLGDRQVAPDGVRADLGDSIERNYKPLVLALRTLPMPVVAAVNGVAAGAGASIALACDLVIAARSASFIQAFCKLGLVPDSGATWMLPRLVGNARALVVTFRSVALSELSMPWKATRSRNGRSSSRKRSLVKSSAIKACSASS